MGTAARFLVSGERAGRACIAAAWFLAALGLGGAVFAIFVLFGLAMLSGLALWAGIGFARGLARRWFHG